MNLELSSPWLSFADIQTQRTGLQFFATPYDWEVDKISKNST